MCVHGEEIQTHPRRGIYVLAMNLEAEQEFINAAAHRSAHPAC